jgi:hypothetical protein
MSGATDAESTLRSTSSATEHRPAKEKSSAPLVAVRSECVFYSPATR